MALATQELIRLATLAGEAHKPIEDRMVEDFRLQEIADDVALVKDSEGLAPADEGYTATYDLYRAASAAWAEKAGMVAEGYNIKVEGASFNRSEVYDHYMQQAGRYAGMAGNLTVSTVSER